MNRPNFRVKVDLSKYYQDVRRFCWVFIDSTKILKISHVKQHITNLFNIVEPYHLCLNNVDYLPPEEDVRIIKEDETLIVIPGSGLKEDVQVSTNFPSQQGNDIKHGTKTLPEEEYLGIEYPIIKQTVSTKDIDTQTTGISRNSTKDVSSNDITFHSIRNDTESDEKTYEIDFKTLDSDITENNSPMQEKVLTSTSKRKRYRKGKKNVSTFIKSATNEESTKKKPKVVDSVVIPSGKHIRFSPFEMNNTELSDHVTNDIPMNDLCTIKAEQTKELTRLLALRLSSTPLTFTNTKIKREIEKTEDISDIEQKDKYFI